MQQMMKPRKLWVTASLMLAALAVACGRTQGGGSGDSVQTAPGDGAPPSLLGTWETGCSEEAGSVFFGGVAHNARYTFTADHTVLLSNVFYSDHACNSEMVKALITGTYALGGADTNVHGSYDLDLKGATLTMSLLDPAKKVINPCTAGGFYLRGSVGCGSVADTYQVVKVAGKAMQLGDDGSNGVGDSPSQRPKTLKATVYTKVE